MDRTTYQGAAPEMRFSIRSNLTNYLLLGAFVALLAGGLALGKYLSVAHERRVITLEGELFSRYMDTVLSGSAPSLARGTGLNDADMLALDKLLHDTRLSERIAALKLWSREGEVLYSTDLTQVGLQVAPGTALLNAFRGETQMQRRAPAGENRQLQGAQEPELVVVHAPVHVPRDGPAVAVAEIHLEAEVIDKPIDEARRKDWAAVALSGVVMYLVLAALIWSTSRRILARSGQLQAKVSRLSGDLAQKDAALERFEIAARRSTAFNERMLHRISSDMHDGPGQALALAAMRLETLADVCNNCASTFGLDSTLAEEFRRLTEALNSALLDLRSICKGLHLPDLEEMSLDQVARRVVRDYEGSTGVSVELILDKVPAHGPLPLKITLFRLLQEALANGFRHGGGVGQHIALGVADGELQVTVRDTGKGFNPKAPDGEGHLGLQGMRERVELLGGKLMVWSALGQGTVVRASMPLEKAAEHS